MLELDSKKNKAISKYYYTALFFLFFFFIAINTPLTGDDWTWGTERGIARLKNNFSNYNGRYVSNILEILLTRFDLLRYFIVTIFSTLLVYTMGKLTSHGTKGVQLPLSFILILLIPVSVFAQTFGWTAGFVNYVPSLVLLFVYLIIAQNIYDDKIPTYSKKAIVFIIPLGILTALIVEHVTLFALFTSGYVIVYTYVKHKKILAFHIAYLASLLFGSLIMFTNGAYWNVLSGNDSYRTIRNEANENTGLIHKVYDVYSGNMYQYLFLDNLPINLFLGIMIIILIVRFTSKSNWINYILRPFLLVSIVGFLIYGLFFKSILGNNFLQHYTDDFEALLSILFFVSIVVAVIFYVNHNSFKWRTLYYLSGVVLLSAPFVFITPYGPRAALASVVFLILAALELFVYNSKMSSWSTKSLFKPLVPAVLVLIIGYGYVFATIDQANKERIALLKEEIQAGRDTIYLPDLPFNQFLWMSSPPNKHFNNMYKRFYKVPEETTVKFVPYEDWLQDKDAH